MDNRIDGQTTVSDTLGSPGIEDEVAGHASREGERAAGGFVSADVGGVVSHHDIDVPFFFLGKVQRRPSRMHGMFPPGIDDEVAGHAIFQRERAAGGVDSADVGSAVCNDHDIDVPSLHLGDIQRRTRISSISHFLPSPGSDGGGVGRAALPDGLTSPGLDAGTDGQAAVIDCLHPLGMDAGGRSGAATIDILLSPGLDEGLDRQTTAVDVLLAMENEIAGHAIR